MFSKQNNKKVLIVASHPDDEVLGCGGTIAKLIKKKYKIFVYFSHEGSSSRFSNYNNSKSLSEIKKRNNMAIKCSKFLGHKIVGFENNPNLRNENFSILDNVKKITKIIDRIKPDIIITHHPDDINEDHQLSFKIVSNATRPPAKHLVKEIYLMEIPSTTDWTLRSSFKPNIFVDVSLQIKKKIDAMKLYKSEFNKYPHSRSKKNLISHSIYRGAQVGLKNVEAFELYKIVI
jgi:LmbE family N-acetylglucosaminyl deacetylase